MVTAAAGSDAAVVLVDITKLDMADAAPVPLLPQTRRHALLAHLLRVPSIVFAVNKLDAVEPSRRQAFDGGARGAARLSPQQAGIARGRHRAGVGAARRQRHATPLGAPGPGTTARRCCSCWRRLPTDRRSATTATCWCRCSTWPAKASRHRQPAAHALGPHRPRPRAGRRRGAGVPERRDAPPWPRCAAPARWSTRCEAGAVGRHGARPPARRVARRLDRHARARVQATQRFAATLAWLDTEPARGRPQVLGAPRQPLGAGAHHRHRAPAGHPHARSAPTRTSWPSTRSAAWSRDAAAAAGGGLCRPTASAAR